MNRTRFGGMNAKRHRMRCTDCRNRYERARYATKTGKGDGKYYPTGRYTLKKRPELYKLAKNRNCPVCGGSNVVSVEAYRRAEEQKQNTCYCSFIPFPHKKGSILGCDHHPKPYEEWTQEDEEQIQNMLATKRSG